jgi:hypothetical protein
LMLTNACSHTTGDGIGGLDHVIRVGVADLFDACAQRDAGLVDACDGPNLFADARLERNAD